MKKMGGPGDVAKIVYFLGSGENLYITGQTVSVSGGE
jgi:NAD(P)-dependent dehydrogenase (short-subunit alcohol dehydrogenase family)